MVDGARRHSLHPAKPHTGRSLQDVGQLLVHGTPATCGYGRPTERPTQDDVVERAIHREESGDSNEASATAHIYLMMHQLVRGAWRLRFRLTDHRFRDHQEPGCRQTAGPSTTRFYWSDNSGGTTSETSLAAQDVRQLRPVRRAPPRRSLFALISHYLIALPPMPTTRWTRATRPTTASRARSRLVPILSSRRLQCRGVAD